QTGLRRNRGGGVVVTYRGGVLFEGHRAGLLVGQAGLALDRHGRVVVATAGRVGAHRGATDVEGQGGEGEQGEGGFHQVGDWIQVWGWLADLAVCCEVIPRRCLHPSTFLELFSGPRSGRFPTKVLARHQRSLRARLMKTASLTFVLAALTGSALAGDAFLVY